MGLSLLRRGTYSSVAALMGGVPGAAFADLLLDSETDGFAIDATDVSATPAYEGAPYAGYVSVIDTGTPANDLSNVALDSSILTNSGTSPKMVLWNSSPYVRWTPHNLSLQSQTLDNAAWTVSNLTVTANDTTAPDGTSTADKLVGTSATLAVFRDTNGVTTLANTAYTYSFYAKKSVNDFVALHISDSAIYDDAYAAWFDLANGVIGSKANQAGTAVTISSHSIESVGNGWYRCSATFTNTSTLSMAWILSASADSSTNTRNGTYWVWGAQLVRGYNANPYLVTTSAARIGIPVEYDTAAGQYGILVEPAATNLCLQSETFGTTWTTGGTLVSNNATAPDGSDTADTVTSDGTGPLAQQTTIAVSASTVYTFSCYLKAGANATWIRFEYCDNAFSHRVRVWFDISTGTKGSSTTVGSGTYTDHTITSIGNGWYRVSVSGTISTAVAATVQFIESSADAVSTQVSGAVVSMWGAQLELGSVATSYIPTLGSTVTRAAEYVTALTTTYPYSSTASTIYADFKQLFAAQDSYAWGLRESNVTGDRVQLEESGGSLTLNNANDGSVSLGAISAGTRYQVSSAFAANDADASIDGAAVASDASWTVGAAATHTYFGHSFTPAKFLGRIYRFVYVPRQVQTDDGNLATWRYS